MPVLNRQDLDHFNEYGYVVVPAAVPQENVHAVIDAIWEFLGMNRDDPEDWYREPLTPGGMVEMYQHQAMWNNRQHPRLYEAFCDILGTEKLWVSEDRVCLKPPMHPAHPEYDHKGFIHWDADTARLPQPLGVQGVLCLTDTTADMGGFQCIPGFHRDLEEWVKTQPSNRNTHAPDLNSLPPNRAVTPIPAQAGDLVIWNKLLAHGNGHNVSSRPRFAQYISMYPTRDDEAVRQARIERWRERRAPRAPWVVGDPRRVEELHGTTADLTPLGRKLLGLDAWE